MWGIHHQAREDIMDKMQEVMFSSSFICAACESLEEPSAF